MSRKHLVVLVLTALLVATQLSSAAAATARLALAGPPSAIDGETFELVAELRSDTGPVPGAVVDLERQVGEGWVVEGSATTDAAGTAVFTVTQDAATAPAVLRSTSAGDGTVPALVSEPLTVTLAETASVVSLTVPEQGAIGREVTVRPAVHRADDGLGVAGAPVHVERLRDGAWVDVATLTTDDDGRAATTVPVRRPASENRFRAVFPGTTTVAPGVSAVAAVQPVRASTLLRVGGPERIVDETSETLTFRWRARDGRPVPGTARVWSRAPGQDWRRGPELRFGADGEARLRVSPRVDTRWKAVGAGGAWWRGDVSDVHTLDNLPPGVPVAYPAEAPRPRVHVPRQPRAVGDGANPSVSGIPDAVWNQMTGRSWHAGCPVGRSELRLVRINYWGYDGYRYRGELVVRDDVVGKTVGAFSGLYRAGLPLRSMYRVDRFGWSDYLHGADNYDSMAAGNTSAFNCRGVVGNPAVPSPHSYGRAIDLNPWENPYHSRRGIVPNTWWAGHSHPRIAWRSGEHPVVRIMRGHGFSWTYGTQDSQHFDG